MWNRDSRQRYGNWWASPLDRFDGREFGNRVLDSKYVMLEFIKLWIWGRNMRLGLVNIMITGIKVWTNDKVTILEKVWRSERFQYYRFTHPMFHALEHASHYEALGHE